MLSKTCCPDTILSVTCLWPAVHARTCENAELFPAETSLPRCTAACTITCIAGSQAVLRNHRTYRHAQAALLFEKRWLAPCFPSGMSKTPPSPEGIPLHVVFFGNLSGLRGTQVVVDDVLLVTKSFSFARAVCDVVFEPLCQPVSE